MKKALTKEELAQLASTPLTDKVRKELSDMIKDTELLSAVLRFMERRTEETEKALLKRAQVLLKQKSNRKDKFVMDPALVVILMFGGILLLANYME
ncbi:hypothetical protein PsorP6_015583 [Peronosclerospora sorghi]|uniref:Uncharacterized protein n=1 Tax=Peronosclerospora sorghi TaxID=230839 RepID=A0ACC0WN77_9STRA|nr:hypothetical protein PsorP6_015583 [Peronosclerospora sorghi]